MMILKNQYVGIQIDLINMLMFCIRQIKNKRSHKPKTMLYLKLELNFCRSDTDLHHYRFSKNLILSVKVSRKYFSIGKIISSQYNRKHMVHTLVRKIPQVKLQTAVITEGQ